MRTAWTWISGALVAAFTGSIAALTVMTIDPKTFNWSTGKTEIAVVAGIGAVKGLAMYLARSPLTPPTPPSVTVLTQLPPTSTLHET